MFAEPSGTIGQACIATRIGYRRRPGRYGGKPAIVAENRLDRQFEVDTPDHTWVTDITYIRTHEGWLYLSVIRCAALSICSLDGSSAGPCSPG